MYHSTIHTCCGTPCFQEYEDQEQYPCWGDIMCVDVDYVEYDGGSDEYRYAACEGHIDMYPSHDKSKYNKPPNITKLQISCDWKTKSIQCENTATEKWTDIPNICPYTGYFEAKFTPFVYHYCNKHIADIIIKFSNEFGSAIEAEKLLRRMFTIEKL